jgi:hypothetical protein
MPPVFVKPSKMNNALHTSRSLLHMLDLGLETSLDALDKVLSSLLPFANGPVLLTLRWAVLASLIVLLWASGQRIRSSGDLKKLAEKNSRYVHF